MLWDVWTMGLMLQPVVRTDLFLLSGAYNTQFTYNFPVFNFLLLTFSLTCKVNSWVVQTCSTSHEQINRLSSQWEKRSFELRIIVASFESLNMIEKLIYVTVCHIIITATNLMGGILNFIFLLAYPVTAAASLFRLMSSIILCCSKRCNITYYRL